MRRHGADDIFIDELDLAALGFSGVTPAATGRPAYHPSTLLKIYLYGYLNRVQSSRRLEREAQRNIELMWLTGRLAPDFKTIADFRKDNGAAIQSVCRQFVELCRRLKLFTGAVVAIDGSKFKAVNNRDKNYTVAKVTGRMEQVNASIARYLRALDQADREESDIAKAKSGQLKEKIAGLRRQMQALKAMEQTVQDAPDQQVSLIDPDARSMSTSGKGTATVGYNVQIAVDVEHHLIVPFGQNLDNARREVPGQIGARAFRGPAAGPVRVLGRFRRASFGPTESKVRPSVTGILMSSSRSSVSGSSARTASASSPCRANRNTNSWSRI